MVWETTSAVATVAASSTSRSPRATRMRRLAAARSRSPARARTSVCVGGATDRRAYPVVGGKRPAARALRAIAVAALELRKGGQRVAAVAGQEQHGVEPEVGHLPDERVRARLGEQHLDRLLADLARDVLAGSVQQAGGVALRRVGLG